MLMPVGDKSGTHIRRLFVAACDTEKKKSLDDEEVGYTLSQWKTERRKRTDACLRWRNYDHRLCRKSLQTCHENSHDFGLHWPGGACVESSTIALGRRRNDCPSRKRSSLPQNLLQVYQRQGRQGGLKKHRRKWKRFKEGKKNLRELKLLTPAN